MQTISLKDNESDFHDVIEYPDRQKTIRLRMEKLDKKKPVKIKCRIRNFSELEVFLCLVESLIKNDFFIESIIYIYLFGMRSDRAFSSEEPNYFRDVIAKTLAYINENILEDGIRNIYVLAPHNNIVKNYLYAQLWKPSCLEVPVGYYLWADDNASFLRNSLCLSEIQTMNVLGSFSKIRKEGKIQGINLPQETIDKVISSNPEKPIIILDDLCDGGATFIAEAQYLRDIGVKNSLHLFVVHGLFTKGLEPLLKYFDKIICTNSYHDITHANLQQIQVI